MQFAILSKDTTFGHCFFCLVFAINTFSKRTEHNIQDMPNWLMLEENRSSEIKLFFFFHQRDRGRDADAERGNGVQIKLEEAVE